MFYLLHYFLLDQKVIKKSRRNDASTHKANTLPAVPSSQRTFFIFSTAQGVKSNRNILIGLALLMMLSAIFVQACQTEQQLTYARYYIGGKKLYEQHCQNCHSADGKGLGELYPPLTDSVFLKSNKDKLACIVKYGLNDTLTVGGKVYEGKMPAETQMPAIEIAQIITYITNSFGNKQGLYDVNAATADLKNCVFN